MIHNNNKSNPMTNDQSNNKICDIIVNIFNIYNRINPILEMFLYISFYRYLNTLSVIF